MYLDQPVEYHEVLVHYIEVSKEGHNLIPQVSLHTGDIRVEKSFVVNVLVTTSIRYLSYLDNFIWNPAAMRPHWDERR